MESSAKTPPFTSLGYARGSWRRSRATSTSEIQRCSGSKSAPPLVIDVEAAPPVQQGANREQQQSVPQNKFNQYGVLWEEGDVELECGPLSKAGTEGAAV
eukprot:CAMPEP_0177742636 /NCGR_PEP_ID=MMETSP0484_2-20121128/28769_1 /TAXON_ID=354590 /ORGANISM="Rhodomonas lens, Strain RHODO" /LENGTH=99 /DNA_ID=CAMNT_0019256987 /DNA_START=21 /DNA_END=319 /DNA_ORIENTATION=+